MSLNSEVVSPIETAAAQYVAKTLQWVDGVAAVTLTDYYTEIVLHAVSIACESLAEEIAKRNGSHLTQSERKLFRNFARDSAAYLLSHRIPSVGRGGRTRLAESPAAVTLVEFGAAIERVYPFWRDVKQRSEYRDSSWLTDAKKLPEYKRFNAKEKRHAQAVLVLLEKRKRVNGAKAAPRVLSREHARLIVGLANASDRQLQKYAATAKALAPKVVPLKRRS